VAALEYFFATVATTPSLEWRDDETARRARRRRLLKSFTHDPSWPATRDDLRRLAWVLGLVWLALAAFAALAQRYLGWRLAVGLIGGAGALFTIGLVLVAAGSLAAGSFERWWAARRERADRAHPDGHVDNDEAYQLRAPSSDSEWTAYHAIRRTVLFERRGRFDVYDAAHPDEVRPGHYPFLLLYNREPIGTIRVDIADDEALFRRVAIREDVQRQGHGRKMLELAEGFVREQHRNRIRSHVDPEAVGFYERCGFTRERVEAGGATILMRKDLR
jgi:GNAT superfamily N-acetyltransferase